MSTSSSSSATEKELERMVGIGQWLGLGETTVVKVGRAVVGTFGAALLGGGLLATLSSCLRRYGVDRQ
jgi:hypothetical protein